MGYVLIGAILGGIIWGVVVNKVIENKGYEENWFWWGFFFGIFALIIAITKQSVDTSKVFVNSTKVSENMELLSSEILDSQVNISSPIHIKSWQIKQNNAMLALIVDFINVSEKEISAVMFSVKGFNAFGDKVQVNGNDFFDILEQDLNLGFGEHTDFYAVLQNPDIRKVEINVKKICFADGTIIDDIQNKWININQFSTSDNKCRLCDVEKEDATKISDSTFGNMYLEYLKKLENEQMERLEYVQQAKKNRRILIVIIIICLVLILKNVFRS